MSELSIAESIRQDYEDEIERLKNINEEHRILNGELRKELQQKENIIKEARKYIEDACWLDEVNKPNSLGHKQTIKLLEILDKGKE